MQVKAIYLGLGLLGAIIAPSIFGQGVTKSVNGKEIKAGKIELLLIVAAVSGSIIYFGKGSLDEIILSYGLIGAFIGSIIRGEV